jgi:NADPH:quinone reductase-like Zn-dependent oxidoreductase
VQAVVPVGPGKISFAEVDDVVRAQQVAVLPDAVSFEQAAALPLAGLTALRLLRIAGSVVGRRVLLTGAFGGVGHYFTELATGAEITAVVSSPERGAKLLELGAADRLLRLLHRTGGGFDQALP